MSRIKPFDLLSSFPLLPSFVFVVGPLKIKILELFQNKKVLSTKIHFLVRRLERTYPATPVLTVIGDKLISIGSQSHWSVA